MFIGKLSLFVFAATMGCSSCTKDNAQDIPGTQGNPAEFNVTVSTIEES